MNRGFYLGVLTGVAARVRTFLTFWPTPANAAAASLATIDSSSTHSFAAFQQQPADVSSRAHQQQQQHHQQSSLAPSVFSFTRKPAMPTANTAAVSFSTASFSSSAAAPSSLHAASNQPSSAASASSSSSASSAASPSPSSPWIDALRTRFDIVPLSADALTADQIAQAHAMLLRCTLTREPLVAQLRTLYAPADIEAAYAHYVDVVMRRCLQRRPHALSLVAVERQSARVCGVLINDMLQDPALPLDPKLCAPMQPILRVLAQLDNAYVRQDAAASTTNTKPASAASSAASSSSAASPSALSAAAATPATPETIAIAPVPKKKTVFSLTSSSESLLHYYPTRRTLRLLLSAIDVSALPLASIEHLQALHGMHSAPSHVSSASSASASPSSSSAAATPSPVFDIAIRGSLLVVLVTSALSLARSLKFATVMGETTSPNSVAACRRAGFAVTAQVDLSAFEFEGAKPFAAVRFDTEATEATSVVAQATPDHMIKLVVKHI